METSIRYAVLIPYYSNLDYLRIALESLLAQTDQDWIAVVLDDSLAEEGAGATAGDLVAELGDPRLGYRRNSTNLGVAGSFNRCFEVARELDAEVATIFHADDVLEQGYVSTMKREHRRHPHAVCVAPMATVIGAEGLPVRTLVDLVKRLLWPRMTELQGDRGLRRLLWGMFFYCPAVSYRMVAVPATAWNPDLQQVMDLDLYGRVLLAGGSIILVEESVYRYRRHSATMTEINSRSLVRTEEETIVSRQLAGGAARQGWSRAARAGRMRPAVRAQAAMRVLLSMARRDWHTARSAAMLAIGC